MSLQEISSSTQLTTGPSTGKVIAVGTRKSKLALWQAEYVVDTLNKLWPSHKFEIHARDTAAGDIDKSTPFKDMPVKNLWTHDLEMSLVEGKLDVLVHCVKDVPTQLPSSCVLTCITARADPRDAFVIKSGQKACKISELPAGSVIGTSSIRRTAQIALKHPHLKVKDVRGNVPTRLAKLDAEDGPFDALVLAAAGLERLGLGDRITQYLDSKNGGMLYAVGQGALGLEVRADDDRMKTILTKLDEPEASLACLTERSLLRRIEGGCSAPLGVESEWVKDSEGEVQLNLRAIVVSVDGQESVECDMTTPVPTADAADAFGVRVAEELLRKGADRILAAIKAKKPTAPIDLGD